MLSHEINITFSFIAFAFHSLLRSPLSSQLSWTRSICLYLFSFRIVSLHSDSYKTEKTKQRRQKKRKPVSKSPLLPSCISLTTIIMIVIKRPCNFSRFVKFQLGYECYSVLSFQCCARAFYIHRN